MITVPTLFILGAGASAPYGYPTSFGLWEFIVGNYPNDSHIPPGYQHPFKHFYSTYLNGRIEIAADREPLIEKLELFHETFFHADPSIDRFISRNKKFEKLGKKAILTMLFHAEQFSALPETMANRESDWIIYLMQKMTTKIVVQDDFSRFKENDVSFITFNYDRSLEHLSYNFLSNSFSELPTADIVEAVESLEILHVNGILAPLDWQNIKGVKQPYRKSLKTVDIDSHVNNIQIIFDSRQDDTTTEIERKIKSAENIYFLGFGYADENMKQLGFPEILEAHQTIYGTAKGLTSTQIAQVKRQYFTKRDFREPHLYTLNCLEVLENQILR
ncbi:MAG: hypothetical protein IIA59_12675 [Candidatus Marinimicrobia bacterium]|nr:hypothetical protein [Candidatus Neomarinimicrobiota bacterium]